MATAQLKKISYICTMCIISFLSYCQERKEIKSIVLNKNENVFSSFSIDSTSASFGFYISGYHIKAKRDSLECAKNRKRRDQPNVIPNTAPDTSDSSSISFWSLTKRNVSSISELSYITSDEYYKNWSSYYFTNKLFVIVPLKNKTYDIWECRLDASE